MDNNLIQNAINGDKKAIVELIKKEQGNIYSMLYYLNNAKDDIYDITQNVLIKLTNKIHQLKNPQNFKTWLNQIIINTYYDYLRKQKNNKEIVTSPDDEKFNIINVINNPQDEILIDELDFVIKTSIENLPLQYKIPITLREIQGLTYGEISNITNSSIGTVKSRISRARSIIQNKIKKYVKE